MKKLHFILTGSAFLVAVLTSSLLYLQAESNNTITIELYDTAEKLSSEIIVTETLREELKTAELEIIEIKENAACLVSLSPLQELISEDEIKNLLKEIPKGNPFSVDFIVTAPFGKSMGYMGSYRQNHEGVDIAPINANWEIYPIAPGTVEQFGYDRVYGKFLYVRHSENVRSFYAHADKIFYRATTGNYVDENTVMMIMGETGMADGPHLHFSIQIRTDSGWVNIDALPFLEGE